MSHALIRRLRGVAGTMVTWSFVGGMAGMVTGAGISLGVLLPRGEEMHFQSIVSGLGIAGALVGAVSGLAFAVLLIASQRRRSFDELRASRLGAWGALAASGIGLAISGSPLFALACGAIGFSAAASTLALARRAVGSGDPVPALTDG